MIPQNKNMHGRRKNFFFTFLLILFFWTIQTLMVFFVEPETIKNILIPNAYLPFFINLFLALFFTLAVIFANSRTGLFTSVGIIFFLYLRIYGIGNLLNLILIIGIIVALELYLQRKRKKK